MIYLLLLLKKLKPLNDIYDSWINTNYSFVVIKLLYNTYVESLKWMTIFGKKKIDVKSSFKLDSTMFSLIADQRLYSSMSFYKIYKVIFSYNV